MRFTLAGVALLLLALVAAPADAQYRNRGTFKATPSGLIDTHYRDGDDGGAAFPSTPELLDALPIGPDALLIRLKTASTGGVGELTYHLYCGLADGDFVLVASAPDLFDDGYTYDELDPETTYKCRVIVEAANGRMSAFSNTVTGTTEAAGSDDDEAPSRISTGCTIDADQHSLTLSCPAATDNVGVDKYWTSYCEASGDACVAPAQTFGSSSEPVNTVVGLKAGTNYGARMRPCDAALNCAGAGDWYFTTTDPIIPAAISGSATSTTSAVITRVSACQGCREPLTLSIKRSTMSGSDYSEVGTMLTDEQFADDALSANTSYFYVLDETDADGQVTRSNEIEVETPSGTEDTTPPDSSMASFAVTNLTATGATFTLTGCTDDDEVSHYDFIWGYGSNGSAIPNTFTILPRQTSNSFTVENADSSIGPQLYARAYCIDPAGNSSAITPRHFETLPVAEPPDDEPTIVITETGGNDSNPCSAAQPCATLGKAISIATAGDVIEMRATGGSWTITSCITFDRQGAANNPIRLQFQSGDTFNFYPSTGCGTGIGVWQFTNADYWVIDGTGATVNVGDRSEHDWEACGSDYPYQASLRMASDSDYNELVSLNFSGGSRWVANLISTDSNYNRFRLLDMGYHGTNNDPGQLPAKADCGDLFTINGHYNIVEESYFHHSGHEVIANYGNGIIIRNNTFSGAAVEGTGFPGLRSALFAGSADNKGAASPWGPQLAEGNIFRDSGPSVDAKYQAVFKLDTRWMVLRYNYIINARGRGIQMGAGACCGPLPNTHEFQQLYHNTWYLPNGGDWFNFPGDVAGSSTANMQQVRVLNNVGTGFASQVDPGESQRRFIDWSGGLPRNTIQGYPDWWLGATIACNQMHSTGEQRIRLAPSPNGGTVIGFAAAAAKWPNVFSQNSDAAPSFVNPAAETKSGLQLASGTGTACPMATVTASSTGTSVTLSNNVWIWVPDPGLAYWGEQGDCVAFFSAGGTPRGIRRVTSRNLSNRTAITVDSAISLTAGDVVRPVKKDCSTVWTNVGAPASL